MFINTWQGRNHNFTVCHTFQFFCHNNDSQKHDFFLMLWECVAIDPKTYSVTNKSTNLIIFINIDQFIKLLNDWPDCGLNPASESTDCQSVGKSGDDVSSDDRYPQTITLKWYFNKINTFNIEMLEQFAVNLITIKPLPVIRLLCFYCIFRIKVLMNPPKANAVK